MAAADMGVDISEEGVASTAADLAVAPWAACRMAGSAAERWPTGEEDTVRCVAGLAAARPRCGAPTPVAGAAAGVVMDGVVAGSMAADLDTGPVSTATRDSATDLEPVWGR